MARRPMEVDGFPSVEPSRRLKDDFDNAEPYYPLDGNRTWLPGRGEDQPGRKFAEWHADTVCRG